MLHTKYKDSKPYGFRQEDVLMLYPIYAYVKYVTPGAGHFRPQGYNLFKLGRGSLGDASYQIYLKKPDTFNLLQSRK